MLDLSLFILLVSSIPKTIYFNLRKFPLHIAFKFPVLISRKIKIEDMTGDFILPQNIYPGVIKIGFSGSFNLGQGGYLCNKGQIIFHGKATFSRGIQLITGKNGVLEFGDNFRCNADCIINCGHRIVFLDDVVLSWRVTVLDGDGHIIRPMRQSNGINIGKHVWINSNATLLKGAYIGNNVVIASCAVLTKPIEEDNVIIGGINKVLKNDISWEA